MDDDNPGSTKRKKRRKDVERRVLTRKEAADYLGISLRLFDEIKGQIPAVRFPGCRRIGYDIEDLDAFIENNKDAA